MSWIIGRKALEKAQKEEEELRANWGNVTFVDESKVDADESERNISRWRKKIQ